MSHHLIEIKGTGYTYPDGRKALEGISMEITHGESVGIIGPNGAGKSTLLMLLAGVMLPGEGQIRIGEIPVTKKTLSHIRRTVGMVFQDPDDQLFMTTVYDDAAFGPRNYKLDEDEVQRRVTRALDMLDIGGLRDRPPYRLSGGEKRAAAIATVLSMEPAILVMDEPSSMLDSRSRRQLIKALSGFTHTKVIATHDLDMVFELCTKAAILYEGKLAAYGPASEILGNEALLSENGLELPPCLQNNR